MRAPAYVGKHSNMCFPGHEAVTMAGNMNMLNDLKHPLKHVCCNRMTCTPLDILMQDLAASMLNKWNLQQFAWLCPELPVILPVQRD